MSDVKETHTEWKSVSSAVSLMYLLEVSQQTDFLPNSLNKSTILALSNDEGGKRVRQNQHIFLKVNDAQLQHNGCFRDL